MIGKFTKPRCFKNINMKALPVIYKSRCNAWMNSEIFAKWFKRDFVPAVKHHQHAQNICSPKALLLIDNCSTHPEDLKSSDGSITCMFLVPNTTSLIQPMDQGILQAAKNHYRKKLLQRVITSRYTETTRSLSREIGKKLTVKDLIYMLDDAWEEASAESIFEEFSKLQINPDAETRSLNDSEMQTESIVSESIMEISWKLAGVKVSLLLMSVTGLEPIMNFRLHCSCQTNKF